MKRDIINLDNETVGEIDLDDSVFAVEVRRDLLARTVNWQLAKRRTGTHKVKGRSEVSATSRKPFRQKGTGRARQGTSRAPQMRGGGVAFGPVVRSHKIDLPKRVRRLALKSALSSKCAEGRLVVLDNAILDEPKTRLLVQRLAKLGWGHTLLVDGDEMDGNFRRAAGNIVGLDVLPSRGANVYDILRRDTLVLTRAAVESLVERLK